MSRPIITNFKCDYHRNGISGAPFHVCIFDTQDVYDKHPEWNDKEPHRMMAVVFEEQNHCAVFNIKLLGEENIDFAKGNSFRGDYFEPHLRKLIAEWNEAHKDDWKKALKELQEKTGAKVSINIVTIPYDDIEKKLTSDS